MPTRILHISTWKVPCGIATYCDNFVRSLNQIGLVNDVHPLVPSEWPEMLPVEVRQWNDEIIEKARGYDLVHIQHEHGLFGYALGQKFSIKRYGGLLAGLKEIGVPSVTTFHTDMVIHKEHGIQAALSSFKRRRLWNKYVSRFFKGKHSLARAIVHTRRTRKSFVKHGFPISSVQVLQHPCLAPRTVNLDCITAKEAIGLPKDSKLVSIFGFLGSYKGHDIAMDAIKLLPENYHLALVGGMHPESKDTFLDTLINRMPPELQNRIHITGWVDKTTADRYFAATDAFLAPYRAETELAGSGAITWALSSGKPVVASKVDAFLNVNRIAECMLMTTSGCVGELSWAIQKITGDAHLGEILVQRATEFCRAHSWEASVAPVIDLYESLGVNTNSQSTHRELKVA